MSMLRASRCTSGTGASEPPAADPSVGPELNNHTGIARSCSAQRRTSARASGCQRLQYSEPPITAAS
jgi:hypothetical protein